jgi:hypothetical protein
MAVKLPNRAVLVGFRGRGCTASPLQNAVPQATLSQPAPLAPCAPLTSQVLAAQGFPEEALGMDQVKEREAEATAVVSPTRPTRTLTIVRHKAKPYHSRRQVYLVTRKATEGGSLLREEGVLHAPAPGESPGRGGAAAPPTEFLQRAPSGQIMKHSILGSVQELEEVGEASC